MLAGRERRPGEGDSDSTVGFDMLDGLAIGTCAGDILF